MEKERFQEAKAVGDRPGRNPAIPESTRVREHILAIEGRKGL
jgi:hypothetical protein